MKFDKCCIVCGCSDSSKLNTVIQLKHSGNIYPVALCDDHEETSPKNVRELIEKKLEEVEKALIVLRNAGMSVSQGGVITVVESTKTEEIPDPEPEPEPEQEDVPKRRSKVIKSSPKKVMKAKSISGVVDGVKIDAGESIDPDSIVSEELKHNTDASIKKIRAQVTKTGRYSSKSGRQIEIPSHIRDNAGGKTDIIIVETDDSLIKQRQQAMNMASEGSSHKMQNYGMRVCPLCKGTSIRKVRGENTKCPKCQGIGVISNI